MKSHSNITLLASLALCMIGPLAAQTKVSDRASLSSGSLDPAADILGIVDTSAGAAGSKKITINNLFTGWGFTTAGKTLAQAADVSAQRTALGLTIGTNVQAWDADLDNWAGKAAPSGTAVGTSDTQTLTNKTLTTPKINAGSDATGDIYYRDSSGNFVRLPIGSAGQYLKVSSGIPSWAAVAGGGDLLSSNNLSDLANAGTARGNLGLAIGTNVQAWDTDLDTWAGKTPPTGTAVGTSDTQTLANKTLGSSTVFNGGTMTLGSDATGDLYYRASGGAMTRLAIGSTGQVLTVASGLPSWAPGGGGGGLTNWTDAISSATPNGTVPAASLTATNAATNVDAVIAPKGSGALTARVPDNTTTGGNKRGIYATDWQRSGAANFCVASGAYSTIGGGVDNRTPNNYSTIAGGSDCTTSGADYGFIGGGNGNNTAGNYGAIAGGYGNGTGAYGAVPGGRSNSATGTYSFAAGDQNTSTGIGSVAMGTLNTSGGDYSVAMGYRASTRGVYGRNSYASGFFATQGDAQASRWILRALTTNATATEMSTDGAGGAAAKIAIPNNSGFSFSGRIIARAQSTNDTAGWRFEGTCKKDTTSGSAALVGTPTISAGDKDTGAASWSVAIDTDTTNGNLRIKVTGAASVGIHWVCDLMTAEASY